MDLKTPGKNAELIYGGEKLEKKREEESIRRKKESDDRLC